MNVSAMRLRRAYIISIILLLATIISKAQDSVQVKSTSAALFLSADYGKVVESLFQKQSKWEFGVSLLIKEKYNFVFEYGYGELNPESVINNGSYTSEGNYYRGGFEYVLTLQPKRYLSSGLMFALSDFSDKGVVTISSDLWASLDETFTREALNANWIEWTLNTEAPLLNSETGFLSNLYWGLKFRLRFLITDLSQPTFDIYAIPGYGKTYSNVVPAANFFIKYRIGF